MLQQESRLFLLTTVASVPMFAAHPTGGQVEPFPLHALELPHDAPVDPELQAGLDVLDERLRRELGVAPEQRACGVLHLNSGRLAWLRPDQMFYGASVPKICILLAYFDTHPEAVESLDPTVERELERMIKRSDNDLAAKYSQLVGLEAIQRLQTSTRYRLYDPDHGGGLFSGKHYGLATPRTGDPLAGHSHAANVRQCLRFYLLLEQGRLVSPAACERMKRIFAAPRLDFHADNFVRGLAGRDVAILRKNGLWEDWHLDTARIEHGAEVYLLAAMVHHPKGGAYLQQLAASVDDLIVEEKSNAPFLSELVLDANTGAPHQGVTEVTASGTVTYTSRVVLPSLFFNELLPSWNVATPPGGGFFIEVRVGRSYDDSWSPYLYVGDWGVFTRPSNATVECDVGRIAIDYFRSSQRFDRAQYRVTLFDPTGQAQSSAKTPPPKWLRRVGLCFSDTSGLALSECRSDPPRTKRVKTREPPRGRRLPVPFRSQRAEAAAISSRICSPTSVAMLLEYRRRPAATAAVARLLYDETHDIYGNWTRAIQGAFSYGVPGYIDRFTSWDRVEESIASAQPLVISIRARPGELHGAPYSSTDGHLLVLIGFDDQGDVHVNDPAAPTVEAGVATYRRDELTVVWLERGGTAYVLLEPEAEGRP